MKRLLVPLASIALLAGFGVASANEPTTLDTASMDTITAGWAQNCDQDQNGSRNYQNNQSFLSPQVNVASLNNISVLSFGTYQNTSQSNNNGNFNH
jgi:hypothetical protein